MAVASTETDERVEQETLPPATEEVHLPDSSYLPVVLAFGVAWALVGVVLTLAVVIIGVIIAAVALILWIRKARSEMAELPLDH